MVGSIQENAQAKKANSPAPVSILKRSGKSAKPRFAQKLQLLRKLIGQNHPRQDDAKHIKNGAQNITSRFAKKYMGGKRDEVMQLKSIMTHRCETAANFVSHDPQNKIPKRRIASELKQAISEISRPREHPDSGVRNLERLAAATGAYIKVTSSNGQFNDMEFGRPRNRSDQMRMIVQIDESGGRKYQFPTGSGNSKTSFADDKTMVAGNLSTAHGTLSEVNQQKSPRELDNVASSPRKPSKQISSFGKSLLNRSQAKGRSKDIFNESAAQLAKETFRTYRSGKNSVTLAQPAPFFLKRNQHDLVSKSQPGVWRQEASSFVELADKMNPAWRNSSNLVDRMSNDPEMKYLGPMAREVGFGGVVLTKTGQILPFGIKNPNPSVILAMTESGKYFLYDNIRDLKSEI